MVETVIPHQCTALSKQSGERCRRTAMKGRTVCYMHGGKSPVGIANPAFKHGRYSKYLPALSRETYETARAAENLLELRDEIALLDARIADLLGRVATGDHAKLWRQLGETYAALRAALRDLDMTQLKTMLGDMDRILETGQEDYTAWAAVQTLIEQRRKIVESETKRQVAAQQMISNTQAMALVAFLLDSVKRHVDDPQALQAIAADFALLNRSAD